MASFLSRAFSSSRQSQDDSAIPKPVKPPGKNSMYHVGNPRLKRYRSLAAEQGHSIAEETQPLTPLWKTTRIATCPETSAKITTIPEQDQDQDQNQEQQQEPRKRDPSYGSFFTDSSTASTIRASTSPSLRRRARPPKLTIFPERVSSLTDHSVANITFVRPFSFERDHEAKPTVEENRNSTHSSNRSRADSAASNASKKSILTTKYSRENTPDLTTPSTARTQRTPSSDVDLCSRMSSADTRLSSVGTRFSAATTSLPSPSLPPKLAPPWDRTVDMAWQQDPHRTPEQQDQMDMFAFSQNRARIVKESTMIASENDFAPYFQLPDSIRFRICQEVLRPSDDSSTKAIRLNNTGFLASVWPVESRRRRNSSIQAPAEREQGKVWTEEYFDSLEEALGRQQLGRYLSVCFSMRADFLTTLLMTRRFHVVYSPFVAPQLQPAATWWMAKYGPMMKHITLEVDMTKLGGGSEACAGEYDMKATRRTADLVRTFVDTQETRRGSSQIGNLTVLVRRYYGIRPRERPAFRDSGASLQSVQEVDPKDLLGLGDDWMAVDRPGIHNEGDAVPYCPDMHLRILDPLLNLKGIVESLRIVGTSRLYATALITRLWDPELELLQLLLQSTDEKAGHELMQYCHVIAPSTAYPFLPGQRLALDYGPGEAGGMKIVEHVRDPRKFCGAYRCTISRNAIVRKNGRDMGGLGSGPQVSQGPMTPHTTITLKSGLPRLRARDTPDSGETGEGKAGGIAKVRRLVKKASRDVLNKGLSFMK